LATDGYSLKKDDGTLSSRNVDQGVSQVPSKDFTERHAQVMTDSSFRLALIISMIMKLCTRQFYIATAFLYADLDEEIYMRVPEGYVRYMLEVHNKVIDPSTHVLPVKNAIYGLVEATRQ
jgi:Reverse transcriptase (RNA-dependent DNA polymerase)